MDINPVDNPELFSDESRAPLIYTVVPILMVIATTAVGLRFYTRAIVLGIVGFDDWLCLTSLTIFLAFAGVEIALVGRGLGRHVGTLPQPNGFRDYFKLFYVTIIFYNLAISSFKLCFLAQYYRIMNTKRMRRMIYAAAAFVGVWTLSQLCLNIFQCRPISGFWEPGPDVKCLAVLPGWYTNAAGNILADVLILLLPLPMIRGLNLPRAQKLALVGIFCLGFLTCAISLVRLRYLPQGADVTWDNVDTMFWSVAEACTGIVCATLPTLRPLAIRYFPTIFKSSSARTGSSGPFGGSNWKPRDIETGRKIKSTVTTTITTNKRGTKQFTNTGGGGGDEETLVIRPAEAWENRDPDNNEQAVKTTVAAKKRSRHMTYLDLSSQSSLEGEDIELQDVRSGGRHSVQVSRPPATYSGGRDRAQSIGNAVEISSGDDLSKPERNLFIRVEREIAIEGSAR
ncbi:Satratoxin biosynthesis SC1 cluster protein 4 [Apiospora arundinis]|uniref:Satratoxin biosynthesis SC1 cluster protein 4 n=1 Tax=Apiospora arundinis TaxID=335852 RepID=A0ABR2I3X3_9PEZI